MRFEYLTTFVSVDYESVERGVWVFKEEQPPCEPIVESLTDSPDYAQQMNRLGNEGWELVAAQPILRGITVQMGHGPPGQFGYGYSLTAGYYLFWKRAIE
jgi:hypothetical protein